MECPVIPGTIDYEAECTRLSREVYGLRRDLDRMEGTGPALCLVELEVIDEVLFTAIAEKTVKTERARRIRRKLKKAIAHRRYST